MRIAIAALVLAIFTGCSASDRDEEAFLDAAFDFASTEELMVFTSQDLILTGDIACEMIEQGQDIPAGNSQVTGVPWSIVWHPANDFLC